MAEQACRCCKTVPTPPMLRIMLKHEGIDFTDFNDYNKILENLKKSKESLKEAIAKGKEIHQSFLLEIAEIAKLNGNLSAEAAIKQIAHIEATISVFNTLKRIMKKSIRRKCHSKCPTGTLV